MEDQIKLLNQLARKLKSEQKTKTRQQALDTLVAAKILTKAGKFTAPYSNLARLAKKNK